MLVKMTSMTNPIKVSDTYSYYGLKVIPILSAITVKRSKIERGTLKKKIHDSNTSVTAQKMKFSITDFFIFCVVCHNKNHLAERC